MVDSGRADTTGRKETYITNVRRQMYTKAIIDRVDALARGFYFELYGEIAGANKFGFVCTTGDIIPFSALEKIENAQILLEREVIVTGDYEGE